MKSTLQSFTGPEPQPRNRFHNPGLHPAGSLISADRICNVLDVAVATQKTGVKLAMDVIIPATGRSSDWKFVRCYIDSTVLLLDACSTIQNRLEGIRCCLSSIQTALHYLDGEHKPSRTVLRQAGTVLESGDFKDRQHSIKLEKCMSRLRNSGKKLSGDGVAPELYEALSGAWEAAVFAIGVLGSAISFRPCSSPWVQPPKADPWEMLLSELGQRMMLPKSTDEAASSMEELAGTALTVQSLLKLISAWQKGGSGVPALRRMALKAVAGELRRRRDELEKSLQPLEEKIAELYRQIVCLRMSLMGLPAQKGDQKEDVHQVVNLVEPECSQMVILPAKFHGTLTWPVKLLI